MILLYNWLWKYTTYIMEACPTIWQRIMYSGILSSVFIRKALFHSCWYDHLWGEEDVIFQNGFANFLRVFFFLACVQQGEWYTQHVCRNGYFLKLNRSHILVEVYVLTIQYLKFHPAQDSLTLCGRRRVPHKSYMILKLTSSINIWW